MLLVCANIALSTSPVSLCELPQRNRTESRESDSPEELFDNRVSGLVIVTECLCDNASVIPKHYSKGCWYKDPLTLIL
ncbi:hypothetical protein GOODEAATRI_000373 [Goodea atripinnis]|uniref:Secreted protein n=1 Tax=Goodea atripinnis TaxID=208336 RepID=A0ABV0PU48_9TELE